MRKQLEKVSPFTPDGRLKCRAQSALDAVSPFEPVTGELRTSYRATVERASSVERLTGLPKEG
jgi:hypothetical protein